jgi:hypothetical protein
MAQSVEIPSLKGQYESLQSELLTTKISNNRSFALWSENHNLLDIRIKEVQKVIDVMGTRTYFTSVDCVGTDCDQELEIIQNTKTDLIMLRMGESIWQKSL